MHHDGFIGMNANAVSTFSLDKSMVTRVKDCYGEVSNKQGLLEHLVQTD